MELKYEIALYICGAVALVYIVLTFISLHRRRKYKGGSKVVVPDYLKNLPYYKFKVRSYKVMKFLLSLSIISRKIRPIRTYKAPKAARIPQHFQRFSFVMVVSCR